MYTIHGKKDQKDEMLNKHAVLVKKLAYQLKAKLPPSVELDDLIQAGMMGLLDAINRYEDTHGAQFETYAAQRIRGSMLDELRSADWLPRSVRKSMREVEAAISQLDYHTNSIARSMVKGRAFTLACISPNSTCLAIAAVIN